MSIKNEGDSFSIIAKQFDVDGSPFTPSTARYRIHDITNDRSIRSWTTITPDTEMTIYITSGDNVIISERSRLEHRQLTIQTNYDEDNQKVGVFDWDVRNLLGD